MVTAMRTLATLICAAMLTSAARAESLSPTDREALLDHLEKLQESVDSKVDARFRMAIAAYREAVSSDDAAAAFYLKCIEKLNFIDQKKKASEFREWKHSQSEHLNDPAFKSALRYQLQWLILTLKASSEKNDPKSLTLEAQEVVDSIFNNAEKLKSQEQTLNQAVTSTVFAKIYELEPPAKSKWPATPMQLEAVYKQVILPPLESPAHLDKLRAAWIKRIRQEEIRFTTWQDPARLAKKNPLASVESSPAYEKFLDESIPELQWQMEMDLFRSGDEGGAAKRMLAHIEKHLTHKSSRNWSEALKTLLTPPQAPTEPPAKPATP